MQNSKEIKKATYDVIRILKDLKLENSNLFRFYCKCAKEIKNSENPETLVRESAIKIFPDQERWNRKKEILTEKYKGDLLESLYKLYELYYNISLNEKPKKKNNRLTDEDIDILLDELE